MAMTSTPSSNTLLEIALSSEDGSPANVAARLGGACDARKRLNTNFKILENWHASQPPNLPTFRDVTQEMFTF